MLLGFREEFHPPGKRFRFGRNKNRLFTLISETITKKKKRSSNLAMERHFNFLGTFSTWDPQAILRLTPPEFSNARTYDLVHLVATQTVQCGKLFSWKIVYKQNCRYEYRCSNDQRIIVSTESNNIHIEFIYRPH